MTRRLDRDLAAAIARSQAYLARSPVSRRGLEGPVEWAERIARYALDDGQKVVLEADASEQVALVTSHQVGKTATTALKAA